MDIKAKIEEFIDDMTSLEVATFTNSGNEQPGSLNIDSLASDDADTAQEADGGPEDAESNKQRKVKAKSVFNGIRAILNDKKLVGYSRFDLDGDTLAYLNDDVSEDLRKYHAEMITKGEEARKNLFNAAVSLVKGNKGDS